MHLPEYLAKCINKDRPQLHCNGQCVLMKKIAEKERKEAKKNLVAYEANAFYVHQESTVFTLSEQYEDTEKQQVLPHIADYTFDYLSTVFRPPIG